MENNYISILKDHLPQIQEKFGVIGLSVFGSVARGENGSESDVDIFVDMPPKIFLMSGLKDYIESVLKVSVDLIRKHSHLSSIFLNQLSRDAITIL